VQYLKHSKSTGGVNKLSMASLLINKSIPSQIFLLYGADNRKIGDILKSCDRTMLRTWLEQCMKVGKSCGLKELPGDGEMRRRRLQWFGDMTRDVGVLGGVLRCVERIEVSWAEKDWKTTNTLGDTMKQDLEILESNLSYAVSGAHYPT